MTEFVFILAVIYGAYRLGCYATQHPEELRQRMKEIKERLVG